MRLCAIVKHAGPKPLTNACAFVKLEARPLRPHGEWSFSFPQLPTTGTHSMRFERPLAASKGTQEGNRWDL